MVDVLRHRSHTGASRDAFLFLEDGGRESGQLTFGELDRRARALAAHLQESGLSGERALLLYRQGLELLVAFMGCLYAGVVAVPAYPPDQKQNSLRLRGMIQDSDAEVFLTTSQVLRRLPPEMKGLAEDQAGRWIATDALPDGLAERWRNPGVREEDTAFLQYTSGSTAAPRGVMVTHRNILANVEAISKRVVISDRQPTFVSWMPLFHDMGLIGMALNPLYLGCRSILMSPQTFIRHPWVWLQAITRYGGTHGGGPNFAYELCRQRVKEEIREQLDLSSWEVAYNGAEPVRSETVRGFAEAFAPCGFRAQSMFPCYGLAEATVFVSGGSRRRPWRVAFDREELRQGRVRVAEGGGADDFLISCGLPADEHQVVVVDPENSKPLEGGAVGEIWVRGASVARGYWGKPEDSKEVFAAFLPDGEGPYLRTGDLGFLYQGELFICGRLKDLIIVEGRNYYPQDIELSAERAHPALRGGSGACFTLSDPERLVLLYQLNRSFISKGKVPAAAEVVAAVRGAVSEEHGLRVHEIVLSRDRVPKTSSGKIQRRLCREHYLQGRHRVLHKDILPTISDSDSHLESIEPGELLRLRQETPEEEWAHVLRTYLEQIAARIVGVEGIDTQRSLQEHGLTSTMATTLAAALGRATSRQVPVAVLFEHSTLTALSSYLDSLLGEEKVSLEEIDEELLSRLEEISEEEALQLMGRLDSGTGESS